MSADDDLDRTRGTLAKDCVDVIQGQVVNHSVVDFHDLITAPSGMDRRWFDDERRFVRQESGDKCFLAASD